MNRLRVLLYSALLLATLTAALLPNAAGATAGTYRSYAAIAVSRSGAAVYVNALVHQDSSAGIVDSPNRTVYLQRLLGGGWQNMLSRHTDAHGRFTVGFLSAPSYRYRLVVLPGASTSSADSAVASSPMLGGVLNPGQSLVAGSTNWRLNSPSAEFTLEVDEGAQFYLMQYSTFRSLDWTIGGPVWTIDGLPAPGIKDRSRLTMLINGDLALVSAAGKPLWSSHTSGKGNALYVQDDGDLVIYNTASQAVWRTGTTRRILLSGSVIPSGTSYISDPWPQYSPNAIGRLSMQRDGNLVLFGGKKAVWSTNTHVAGSHAAFTPGGTLAVYSPTNKLLWRSASFGPYSWAILSCGTLEFTTRNSHSYAIPSFEIPASCSG